MGSQCVSGVQDWRNCLIHEPVEPEPKMKQYQILTILRGNELSTE